jgi:LytS/YehU family sensor histidine kinase
LESIRHRHIGWWVAATYESPKFYGIVAFFSIVTWLTMWFGMQELTTFLDRKIEWTKNPMSRLIAGLVMTTAFALLVGLCLKYFFELSTGIRMGNVIGVLTYNLTITLVITFFLTSRSFLLNWRQTSIDAERLKKESIAAQYESLKNQVNPHFLFNSFNVLSNLVYEDPDKAVKFIKQLSEVYRYVLDSRTKELVNLEDELHFLRSYVFLQEIRFGEKLKISIELDETKTQVAPLALQMLVENAIKHNIVSEEDPLSIRIFRERECIVVHNNLQKKTGQSEPSPGLGLHNIIRRYEFLTDQKVLVEKTAESFTVKHPLIPN